MTCPWQQLVTGMINLDLPGMQQHSYSLHTFVPDNHHNVV